MTNTAAYVAIVILMVLSIGILAFKVVTSRLKEKIEEIKQLNTIEERNRIALDLHDGRAQDLASIIKRLELCERLFNINPGQALQEIKDLRGVTKIILDKTRQMIFDLKSPRDSNFNLFSSLIGYIEHYQKGNNIEVKSVIPEFLNSIPPDAARSIFYIIKEAFTNVWKHSQAGKIELGLAVDDNNLRIDIRDDGAGFDVDEALKQTSSHTQLGHTQLGLKGMAERTNSLKGTFDIRSKAGSGTKISIIIPLRGKCLTHEVRNKILKDLVMIKPRGLNKLKDELT